MKCNCNKNCMISKEELLNNIENRYNPCPECDKKRLKKSIPIKRQVKLDDIDANYKKCLSCGKRHIDIVMAHILKIMIENNFLSLTSSIRKVGTPLITPAIVLDKSPYLSENSLVLITTTTDEKISKEIYGNVPEVKAVIKGDVKKTVGQLNEKTSICNYQLLAGCDIRCDIQKTPMGSICLFKPQSQIHIEYPKEESSKIQQLDNILKNYDNPTLIDAMSGAGTLGIYALLKNANKVHFNDIYDVAVDTTKTNLKLNNISTNKYNVTNENIHDLVDIIDEKYDIGIIDAFPGVDVNEFKTSLKKICKDVFII